jgi:hypothetical protein
MALTTFPRMRVDRPGGQCSAIQTLAPLHGGLLLAQVRRDPVQMQIVAGEVIRHRGGHNGGRRLPDRWTIAEVDMPAAYTKHVLGDEKAASAAKGRWQGAH